MEKQEVRGEPRFSMNSLAEYLIAKTASERRSLILRQMVPPVAPRVKYEAARPVISRHLSRTDQTSRDLILEARRLRDRAADPSLSEAQSDRLVDGAMGVEAFARIPQDLRARGAYSVVGKRQSALLEIEGVVVSVRPDILFVDLTTKTTIGAMKLHFAQKSKLDDIARTYGALLLYRYLEATGESPRHRHCVFVDVFTKDHAIAPKSMTKRWQAVEEACREIVSRWDSLIPAGKEIADRRNAKMGL